MCGGAAGTIQNLSREEKSRALLLESFGAVEPLADLLVGRHVKSQVGGCGCTSRGTPAAELRRLIAPPRGDL